MVSSPLGRLSLATLALAALLSLPLAARAVSAAAINGSATIQDGHAQVTFTIEVTNTGDAAMTGVSVVYEDGSEVALADVAPHAAVQSDAQSRTVEVGDSASRSVPIKVTLKYSQDGDTVESPCILSVLAAEGGN